MRAGIVVNVARADRLRLEAIIADRSTPQKHVWRANVVLATADGCGTAEIMRRSGKSKPVVWTWQARFMAEGVEAVARQDAQAWQAPAAAAYTFRLQRASLGANESGDASPSSCRGYGSAVLSALHPRVARPTCPYAGG
jgi:hypothetical protein